jgi:hypothetical protein
MRLSTSIEKGRAVRSMVPALAVLIAVVALQACGATGGPLQLPETAPIVVEGVLIRNELPVAVTDVMINVADTGAFAGCGNIVPRSDCRIRFEAVSYSGSKMVVSWKEYGKPQKTDEFVLRANSGVDAAKPVWVEVVIFAMGQAGAKLVQK